MEKKERPSSKMRKTKWSVDRQWNFMGGGHFFNISDLNLVVYRAEKDGTHNVTVLISGAAFGFLFGNDKKSALAVDKLLRDTKVKYRLIMQKYHSEHHAVMTELVKQQKKLIKCHE